MSNTTTTTTTTNNNNNRLSQIQLVRKKDITIWYRYIVGKRFSTYYGKILFFYNIGGKNCDFFRVNFFHFLKHCDFRNENLFPRSSFQMLNNHKIHF